MNEFCLIDALLGTFTGDLMRYVLGAGGVFLIINIALAPYLHNHKIRANEPPARQLWWEIMAGSISGYQ